MTCELAVMIVIYKKTFAKELRKTNSASSRKVRNEESSRDTKNKWS